MSEIENHLAELRQKRGFSAIQLAKLAGVTRQTIYSIEAGSYIPNTVVALKLARALDVAMPELFSLASGEDGYAPRTESAELLPGTGALLAGQAVQLCRVDERMMASAPDAIPWYFPLSDGVVKSGPPASGGKAEIEVFQSEEEFAGRILVAGCDPAISVLARHAQSAGLELVLAHRNSSQALRLLEAGAIHVAGTHLKGAAIGKAYAVISFAEWEEGIVTAHGNPKTIRGVEDLARKEVSMVNREEGAGCRALLDGELERLAISGKKIKGYETVKLGHLAAARAVRDGQADCCVATRSVARAYGLGFMPLTTNRYELVVRKKHLETAPVRILLETMARSSFRRELEGLGGYDTRRSGEVQK